MENVLEMHVDLLKVVQVWSSFCEWVELYASLCSDEVVRLGSLSPNQTGLLND